MDTVKYQELLAKYLKGECTEAERYLLEQWYDSLDREVQLSASKEEKKQLLAKNWESLSKRRLEEPPIRRFRFNPYWAAAAVLVFCLGIGWLVSPPASTSIVALEKQLFTDSNRWTVNTNSSNAPEKILLSDQSTVTLYPNSKIEYPRVFEGKKREIKLVGEAFFEITKNPKKPFFVYANHLVTKVLGTSFRVKAYHGERDVTVTVRTGRVSVFSPKPAASGQIQINPETPGVVLTPNQQVTFLSRENRLVKNLVAEPEPVVKGVDVPIFTFNKAPLSTIISAIEKTYGIDILYDEEVMSNCFITTTLEQENLYEKLDIICKLLGASYQVIDAQVVISGSGCQ